AVTYLNDGTGLFVQTYTNPDLNLTREFYGGDLGDIDGDGDLDLVLADSVGNENWFYLNDGSGDFTSIGTPITPVPTTDAVFGDFDGDGDLDICYGLLDGNNEFWFYEGCTDLRVTKSSFAPAVGNDPLIPYFIAVQNVGPVYALETELLDILSPGLSLVSSVPAPDVQQGPTNRYLLGTLAPGATRVVNLSASVQPGAMGFVTNLALVSSRGVETTPADNEDEVVTPILNADNDAMPDFIDPDDDNDGFSDEDEAIAGTDSTNAASFFHSSIQAGPSGTGAMIVFPSAPGRVYQIQACTNLLMEGGWETVINDIPGAGGMQSIALSNSAQRAFFRIIVEQP
ncbi:MAG: DUF11 domain-containing protein, partial [Verrucomicrobiota bacterium]